MKKVIMSSLLAALAVHSVNADEGIGRFAGNSIAPTVKSTPLTAKASGPEIGRFAGTSIAPVKKAKHKAVKAQSADLMAEAQQILDNQGVDALANWICSKAQEIVGNKPMRSSAKKKAAPKSEMVMGQGMFG